MIDAASLPHGPAGRLLAVLLPLVVIAAAYLLIVTPLVGLYADRTSLLAGRDQLRDKLVATAAELPQLRAQLSELSTTSNAQQATLQGASDPVATASLQNRVEQMAASAGAAISSTETLPPEIRDYYRRLGLRVVLNGSFDSLVNFISALETSSIPLIVDNLQIHVVQSRAGANQTARLDAAVDVYGFRANDQPSGARP
jgi:Tfp pilus assembly protein PilO